MTSSIPSVGAIGPGYAQSIDDFLTEVKNNLEAKIPFSAIVGTGGALDANNQGIGNVNYLGLYPLSIAPTAANQSNLALATFNNDLYWVNNTGAVKVTSGAGLNASGIAGIGGDYGGSNPAALNFVDATSTYEFYDNFAGSAFAYIKTLGTYVVNGGATALIKYGGVATYNFILPTTLPASNNSVMTISSTGQVSHNEAITNDPVLSGTTKIQHGSRSKMYVCRAYKTSTGAVIPINNGFIAGFVQDCHMALDGVLVDHRVNSVKVRCSKADTSTSTFVIETINSSGAQSIGSATTGVAGVQTVTVSVSSPAKLVAPNAMAIKFSAGHANDEFYTVEVVYDAPA